MRQRRMKNGDGQPIFLTFFIFHSPFSVDSLKTSEMA